MMTVPKVIDFGLVKPTQPELADHTMLTEYGMVVGTLEYMSPEQAELDGEGVDTRSDIYSLGVLLYRLITGTTPLGPSLRKASITEAIRLIKEDEPQRPSSRLSAHHVVERHRSRSGPRPFSDADARRRGSRLDRHEVPGEGPHAAL